MNWRDYWLGNPLQEFLGQQEELRRALEGPVAAIRKQLEEQQVAIGSVGYLTWPTDILEEATAAITRLRVELPSAEELRRRMGDIPTAYRSAFPDFRDFLDPGQSVRLALENQVTTMTAVSAAAESLVAGLDWEALSGSLDLRLSQSEELRNHLDDFLLSYRDLYHPLDVLGAVQLPPTILAGPPNEVFRHAEVLATVSTPAGEVDHPETAEDTDEYATSQADEAEELLARLDPNLLSPLSGVRSALGRNEPDRSRHVTVSLRELFTHVLHHLAPDSAVRAWTDDPSHYHEGRPVRRARLLFICKTVNKPPLSRFVECDVEAALELLDILQRGTHQLGADLEVPVLQALIRRVESLVVYLVTLALEDDPEGDEEHDGTDS